MVPVILGDPPKSSSWLGACVRDRPSAAVFLVLWVMKVLGPVLLQNLLNQQMPHTDQTRIDCRRLWGERTKLRLEPYSS